ncbi:MAG: fumarylacetoacetate hydrolase family protein [Hyphomicrobiaceae bacterium]
MPSEDPTLGLDQIDLAAAILEGARRTNTVIEGLPAEVAPKTLADAYAVQDRLVERLGWETRGWFCACTNVEIQRMLSLSEPYCARLFARALKPSPATLRQADYPPIIVECEFAFRLGVNLPPRAEPYTRPEVEAAIESVHPSIEVVAGYLKDWPRQNVFAVIADNGTDGALVYGEGIREWRGLDLATVEVRLSVNGEETRRGSGRNVLGDPLTAFVWLANARAKAGDGLKAGHIHNTGTATAIMPLTPGDHVVADFGPIGRVSLKIV